MSGVGGTCRCPQSRFDVDWYGRVFIPETWRFSVTVAHADEGWDHYADAWDVVGPDGTLLGTRTLAHPHETEQPFTRSLGGVFIPADVHEVTIRARDSVHGYGGAEVTVELSR